MTREDVRNALSAVSAQECPNFECADGWLGLLNILAQDTASLPMADREGLRFLQIKEKWGGLRVYYGRTQRKREPAAISFASSDGSVETLTSRPDDPLRRLVDATEIASNAVCEVCGQPGRRGESEFFVQTLCDEHAAEAKQVNRQPWRLDLTGREVSIMPDVLACLSRLWGSEVTAGFLHDQSGLTIEEHLGPSATS